MRLVGIDHVNLPVADLQQAGAFYCDLLGLTAITRPDFDVPECGSSSAASRLTSTTPGETARPTTTSRSQSTTRRRSSSRSSGPGVKVQPTSHVPGARRQLFARDPFGNVIEFNQAD